MTGLVLDPSADSLRVLFLGAHADDIEIGCFGALEWLRRRSGTLEVRWVVLSAKGRRAAEARRSAGRLMGEEAAEDGVQIGTLPDAYFPERWGEAKEWIARVSRGFAPHLVFTHHRDDRHQDHRVVAELTWNLFREALILEYEIPKYDGELGQPNAFVPLDEETLGRKARHLLEHFPSQADRPWFTADTFRSLARLRGVESGAETGYSEAFHARKLTLLG